MLPPLNLAESKSSFFSRKRIDGRGPSAGGTTATASPLTRRPSVLRSTSVNSSIASPCNLRDGGFGLARTPRDGVFASSRHPFETPTVDALSPEPTPVWPASAPTDRPSLEDISMIPREFFVLETNAVLPVSQFPPSQYQSHFSPRRSLWETVVFPALSPQTRQQVLFLQQALAKMRAGSVGSMSDEKRGAAVGHHGQENERMKQRVAYTKEEWRVYSLCFHELIRQIKCICREQSELLFEIRQHYDVALSFLVERASYLQTLVDKQQQQIGDLVSQHDQALRSNDALLEQMLRAQSLQDKTLIRGDSSRQRRRRGQRCCDCQRDDRDDDDADADSDEDNSSDDECDDEELAWRRQRRRNCVQLDELYRTRKRDSIGEENVAAARLQSAYHKYHLRKEQHRLALREEKNIAALDIQRSYRGFRQRQLALHRRAVVQVILKRRKEAAAIELLQANVRSYLLKQKKEESKKLKRSAAAAMRASSSAAAVEAKANGDTSVSVNEDVASLKSQEACRRSKENGGESCPEEIFMNFLNKFSELTLAISGLSQTRESLSDAKRQSDETTVSSKTSALSGKIKNDSQNQIEEKLQQAEELVQLFHAAVASLRDPTSSQHPDPLHAAGQVVSYTENRRSFADVPAPTMAQSTSTSSLDLQLLPFDVFADLNEQIETKNRRSSVSGRHDTRRGSVVVVPAAAEGRRRLNSIATPPVLMPVSSGQEGDLQHNGDFNLDESLWNAKLSAIQLDENKLTQRRNAELLSELLASRDTKKKFVWLKQFISDTYDSVVGKLREVPLWSFQRFIRTNCALAMSLDEWRDCQQRSIHHNEEDYAVLASVSLSDLIRDHFRCQSGLKHLVDSAIDNLHTSLGNFKSIDPDVHRFHAFLNMEKSHDELLFYCVCRHLAFQDSMNFGFSVGADCRQPVFHPDTMRELITLSQALRIAKTLFRVDEETSIRNADATAIEVENAVYRRYQPSSAFGQFEAVLSGYYLTVEMSTHGVSPNRGDDGGETAKSSSEGIHQSPPRGGRRSVMGASPRSLVGLPPGSMVRPSNVHQFHARQFHAVAPRSPLIRRHQQRPETFCAEDAKWVHFDDFVELLLKYQSEMSHFHLFTRWARDVYAATVAADHLSASVLDPETPAVQLLSDTQFVDALVAYSLGPTERELTNIFHNALRQRALQQWMPPRVFVSIALLLLRNGLLSVSSFRPQGAVSNARRGPGVMGNKNQSMRAQNDDRRWMRLALKWRSHEAAFEKALEAIYETPASGESGGGRGQATRLLELRNELYKLFISSSGADNLQRAENIYQLICIELRQAEAPGSVDVSGVYQDDEDGAEEESIGGLVGEQKECLRTHLDHTHRQEDMGEEGSAWETDSTV